MSLAKESYKSNNPGGKPHDSNANPQPPQETPISIVTSLASPRGSLDFPHDEQATPTQDNLDVPNRISSLGSPSSIKTLSCSQLAEKLELTLAMLHDHATYCITLPGAGGNWDHKDRKVLWPQRDRHDAMFKTFREAIQPRQWPQEFSGIKLKGATPTIEELQDSLARRATEMFANSTALVPMVKEYLRPKLGNILQLVVAARDTQDRLKSNDVDKPLERDFRKCLDDFFHDLLDDNDKRFTMAERSLNLPRNKFCDAIDPSGERNDRHVQLLLSLQVNFREYLYEMQKFAALPAFKNADEKRGPYTGKLFVKQASNPQNRNVDFGFSLFRVAAAKAWKAESAIMEEWNALTTLSFADRMHNAPRTGTCDAFTFMSVDITSHLPLDSDPPPPGGKPKLTREELRKHLLQRCSLARLSNDEVKPPKRAKPAVTDGKMFCPDIGRLVDPEDISDSMGASALLAAIQKLQQAASGPEEPLEDGPRTRQSITSETIYADLGLQHQTPLLLPLLIHEYKRNSTSYIPQGGCQVRIYLTAACRFLELLGIIQFIVFGILLEGSSVVVIGAWKEGQDTETKLYPTWIIDHNTVRYDLTQPHEAYQFAQFVSWIHRVHGPALEKRLTPANIKKFVDAVGKQELDWTAMHQNPLPLPQTTKAKPDAEEAKK